jgi:hypothetical protein
LKEIGNNAELKAKEIYKSRVSRLNDMEHEPPPPNNSGHVELMSTNPKTSVPDQNQTE